MDLSEAAEAAAEADLSTAGATGTGLTGAGAFNGGVFSSGVTSNTPGLLGELRGAVGLARFASGAGGCGSGWRKRGAGIFTNSFVNAIERSLFPISPNFLKKVSTSFEVVGASKLRKS